MVGRVTASVIDLVVGRLGLYLLLGGAGILAVFMLVGGKSLLAAVGIDPGLAGSIAALLTTAVSVALLVAFAKYGIDW